MHAQVQYYTPQPLLSVDTASPSRRDQSTKDLHVTSGGAHRVNVCLQPPASADRSKFITLDIRRCIMILVVLIL